MSSKQGKIKIKQKLYYGFLDESGILEKTAKAGNYFVIVVIIIGQSGELKQVIKSARRKVKRKLKIHKIFKAHKENPGFVKMVLQELSRKEIAIVIGVWDKQVKKQAKSKNILYIKLLTQTVDIALNLYFRLSLVVHKRYTNPVIRNQINQQVNQSIAKFQESRFISLDHRTELECPELEIADAVAWAVFQKYNNKRVEFYEIIKEKIVKENRLAA